MSVPGVAWTTAARRKVHPRRIPGAVPPDSGPSRAEQFAKLAKAYRRVLARKDPADAVRPRGECARLMERTKLKFGRSAERPRGSLDPRHEGGAAVMLGVSQDDDAEVVGPAAVGYWISAAGPAFAVECLGWTLRYAWDSFDWVLLERPALPDSRLRAWSFLRERLAVATESEYRSALKAATRLRADVASWAGPDALVCRLPFAFAFPSQAAWAEQDARELLGPPGSRRALPDLGWCLFACLTDRLLLEQLAKVACASTHQRWFDTFWTLVDALGADAFPLLRIINQGVFYAEGKKKSAEAISLVSSREVADWFAGQLGTRYVSPVAMRYLKQHPDLAVPALGAIRSKAGKSTRAVTALLATLTRAGESAADAHASPRERPTIADVASQLPAALTGPAPRGKLPAFCDIAVRPAPILEASGRPLPEQAVERLARMLAASTLDRPHPGLQQVARAFAADSLSDFALSVFEAWLQAQAPPAHKWALLALAHVGGDEAARRLSSLVPEWPKQGAAARASLGLETLARIDSDIGLTYLQRAAQRLTTPAVRKTASLLLQKAAKARGIAREQLADVVPDLGLDAAGRRRLELGGDAFTVGFDAELRPIVLDADGVRLQRLPAAKQDDMAGRLAARRWREMQADAEVIRSLQLRRLEQAMCRRQSWSRAALAKLVAHPLARHLAQRVVWETRHRRRRSPATFRVAEDGSLADPADAGFALTRSATARIPHPLEMDAEVLRAWTGVFDSYQLLQPFEQLRRACFAPTDDEKKTNVSSRFAGGRTSQNRLRALAGRGWRPALSYDEIGEFGSVRRPVHDTPFHVELDVADDGTLGPLMLWEGSEWTFLKKVPFGRLDPIEFSEIIRELQVARTDGASESPGG